MGRLSQRRSRRVPNVEKAARHEQAVAHCRAWADIEAAHEARQGPLVEAAERALEEVARARVRDVLMQFEEGEPVRYSLFAVLDNADDEDDVRAWLARCQAPHSSPHRRTAATSRRRGKQPNSP